MLTRILAATDLVLAFANNPASAQDQNMLCDEATMTKMNTGMGAMTDAAKKDEAMKEMQMAKDAMDKKDNAGCKMHMANAMKMMPKQ
jgi:hypothetical protein